MGEKWIYPQVSSEVWSAINAIVGERKYFVPNINNFWAGCGSTIGYFEDAEGNMFRLAIELYSTKDEK